MGLTAKSSGLNLLREAFNVDMERNNPVIALAGNPNTGKSTVFNALTGLKQHTGNWPGKTVTQAQGYYQNQDQEYTLVDLPGTYSLLASSTEEMVARDFICFAKPDATIVVADATNLERNLNLVLQVTELTDNVVLCLNLMDEAERKKIKIDIKGLEGELGIPVIPTIARDGIGLNQLKDMVTAIVNQNKKVKPVKVKYSPQIEAAVEELLPEIKNTLGELSKGLNLRWLALRLLEGDQTILDSMQNYYFKESLESEVDCNGID